MNANPNDEISKPSAPIKSSHLGVSEPPGDAPFQIFINIAADYVTTALMVTKKTTVTEVIEIIRRIYKPTGATHCLTYGNHVVKSTDTMGTIGLTRYATLFYF